MKPLEFKEQTSILAKDQPQYRPLPVFIQTIDAGLPTEHLQFMCKYELSEAEIEQIVRTKSFFISQFGNCFHPIFPCVESQFYQVPVTWEKSERGLFYAWVPLTDGGQVTLAHNSMANLVDRILERFPELTAENLYFVELIENTKRS